MEQTHGTWGNRIVTWQDESKLVAILYLRPLKRCSWHKHDHSYNQFFVIDGTLIIKTDIGPDNQRNYTMIKKGQTFTVGPGTYHEFRTVNDYAIVEEIAYVKYDAGDIQRMQLGGDMATGRGYRDAD
jgi:mannose-6-phosphate isomerase-like protein (cupin superfamily)